MYIRLATHTASYIYCLMVNFAKRQYVQAHMANVKTFDGGVNTFSIWPIKFRETRVWSRIYVSGEGASWWTSLQSCGNKKAWIDLNESCYFQPEVKVMHEINWYHINHVHFRNVLTYGVLPIIFYSSKISQTGKSKLTKSMYRENWWSTICGLITDPFKAFFLASLSYILATNSLGRGS